MGRVSLESRLTTERTKPDAEALVYCVDDDAEMRGLLGRILKHAGFESVECASGLDALTTIDPARCGCILIDLQLPDMTGLELHRQLQASGCHQPFIVVSGHRDVEQAVQCFRDGAVDFLIKPFRREELLDRVRKAVERDRHRRRIDSSMEALTDRERTILRCVSSGKSTKQIARFLGISPRTVDVHRHNILKKMKAESMTQVVQTLSRNL